jgi:hypothetical protein
MPPRAVAHADRVAVQDELVEVLARRLLLRGSGSVTWVSARAREVLGALRPGGGSAVDAEIEDHEVVVLYTQVPVPIRKRPSLPGTPKPQTKMTAARVEVRDSTNGGGLVVRLWFTTLGEGSDRVLTAMAELGPLSTVEIIDQPPGAA